MKRPELFTILSIALAVAVGGWFLLRPKHDTIHGAAEPAPQDLSKAETAREPTAEPAIQEAQAPVQKPVAKVAAHEPASVASVSQGDSHGEPNAVYEANSRLTAGVLPEDLVGFLKRGLIPDSEDILKSSDTSRHQEKDSAGQSLEEMIRNFVAAQPESAGVNYMISCGVALCELQMEQVTAESGNSALSLIEFKIMSQPWFSFALAKAGPGGYGSKDKHFYLIRYWKRQ